MFKGISARFTSITAMGMLATTLAAAVGLWGFNDLEKGMSIATERQLPLTSSIGKAEYNVAAIIQNVVLASVAENEEEKNKYLDQVEKSVEGLDKALQIVLANATRPENKEAVEGVNKVWSADKPMLLGLIDQMRKDNNPGSFVKIAIGLEAKSRDLMREIDQISQENILYNESLHKEATTIAKNDKNIIYAIVAISYLALMSFGTIVSRRVSRSLSEISTRITESGSYLNHSSTELSSASQSLAASQSQSSASLEEVVASLEELSSIVRLNAENAQQANALSQKSRESAEHGEKEVSGLVQSMHEISSQSKKIEEIITVIDDIAFQTNLLALNASVEAARAGEQGRGFAVVADAVRSLAQRSASAAKDISNLIKESVEKTELGSKVAEESGKALHEILVSVKKVADLNAEIAAGSKEQSIGIDQVSKAMNQIDQSTQQNAATSEEVSASSDELKTQSSQLTSLSKDLSVIVSGKS